jgi:hypothetical protein
MGYVLQETERQLRDMQKLNKTHEENALKRDKAIKGLSDLIQGHEVKV